MKVKKDKDTYDLPKGFYQILSVTYRSPFNDSFQVMQIPSSQMPAIKDKNLRGRPTLFAISDAKIIFDPCPDRSYSFEVYYTVAKKW